MVYLKIYVNSKVMAGNDLNQSFGTLSQTINELVKLGYTHDFNIKEECLICHKTNTVLMPEDFQIDHVYRFDGDSDPQYQSILYAISSDKYDLKGTLVDGYGTSYDDESSKLVAKLKIHHQDKPTEITANSATTQRPEGDRILNAPLVEMDLKDFIEQIKSESTWNDSDRNSVTIFKNELMRIVLIGLHANAELKPHKADGVISVQVLQGEIVFATEQEAIDLKSGKMVALQENIIHSVKARSESFFLLTLAMNQRK